MASHVTFATDNIGRMSHNALGSESVDLRKDKRNQVLKKDSIA